MKKTLVSSVVIIAFVVYAVYIRMSDASQKIAAITPTPTVAAPTDTPAPTTTPTTAAVGSTPPPTSVPTSAPTKAPTGAYRDGSYTGSAADAFYGNIQVKVTVSSGKISDVTFLQYPNDRPRSVEINTQAMPFLKQEAIAAQSANVDIVSGATDSSQAFIESMKSALSQAKT